MSPFPSSPTPVFRPPFSCLSDLPFVCSDWSFRFCLSTIARDKCCCVNRLINPLAEQTGGKVYQGHGRLAAFIKKRIEFNDVHRGHET